MYCIDGVRTLKNCKPTLILESLNKDQKQYANVKRLSQLITNFKGYLTNAASTSFQPAFAAAC